MINPHDAAARGIHDGDVVRVFNDRGQMLTGARVTEDVRAGVIRVNEGGWFDPFEPDKVGSLCKYGDVEKYQGTPPPVTVFSAPVGSA
jgi:trimethylamine-N-oxide reductase (cytochrome c)